MLTKKQLVIRSLFISSGLLILKVTVGLLTNSLAVLATAADSLMDLTMSTANYFFIRSSDKPPDDQHPYGHGKIESIAGLLQSMFMGLVALSIAGAAIVRFTTPADINYSLAGISVMVIAIGLNFWHVRNLRESMLSSGSQIMATEYVHYASDFLIHFGVVASILLFELTHFVFWDPLMSILISVYILYSISLIFNTSIGELMDEQLPEPILKDIKDIIMNFHPSIISFHELRTRKVGKTKFIEFHLELKDIESFEKAHDITENLISALKKKYSGAVVTVHSDPEGGR